MRSAFKIGVVALAALTLTSTLTSCVGSAESDMSSEVAAVELHEIVSATSGVSNIAFSVGIASGDIVVLSATGVLDVPALHGFRTDSAGLDGAGLEPLAEMWLESNQHYESIDGETAELKNGGLASFLSINDGKNPASLLDVIDHWLVPADPQDATRETIDGVVTTRMTLDRPGREPLQIWIDSGQRLVRVVEVGDQIRPMTITHFFEYPDSVAIPVRP